MQLSTRPEDAGAYYNFSMLGEIFKALLKIALAGLGLGLFSAFLALMYGKDVTEWFIVGILPAAMIILLILGVLLFFAILWGILELIFGSWFR